MSKRNKNSKQKRQPKAGHGHLPLKQRSQAQQFVNNMLKTAQEEFRQFYFVEKDYQKAIQAAKKAHQLAPKLVNPIADIATCYIYLQDWQNAIDWSCKALKITANHIQLHDNLSHAYGAIKKMDLASHHGLSALTLRDAKYGSKLSSLENLPSLPPPPSPATRQHNIISFSLFGQQPKYCETAILNVIQANKYYPNWTCRFYVADDVPQHVRSRLQDEGAEIVCMSLDDAIPPTLWRFLVLDDAQCHRAIFRDADSLLSQAEALAVQEWIDSDAYFHMMRDGSTHTELILAGMWGAVGSGALTQEKSIRIQVIEYLSVAADANARFVDQYFLRDVIWHQVKPYLLQHDSQFGFLDARSFPADTRDAGSHIGSNISTGFFSLSVNKPNGSSVAWQILDKENKVICTYADVVQAGKLVVHMPRTILEKIDSGEYQVSVVQEA